MRRLAIILCFITRVIYGIYTTVQHETFSEHISRQSRSNLPTLQDVSVYRQFDKPEGFSVIPPTVDPYTVRNNFGSGSFSIVGKSEPPLPVVYEDIMKPFATPSILKSEVDYALGKSAADLRLQSAKITSDTMINKLKSLMHYHPPPEMSIEHSGVYDGSNFYHMDDDDIRSSSRNMYDNWPYFYHSPYEYELNKEALDTQKAKDKRYATNEHDSIIPVSEHIENDVPQPYTPRYVRDRISDNPVSGDAPFFSFVLNDYFERSGEDDPLTFKGIGSDWGSEFDHNTYMHESLDNRKSDRNGDRYYSTISPVTVNYDVYKKTSESELGSDSNSAQEYDIDKDENSINKNSKFNTGFTGEVKEFNGFKDFLDSFANKFGSQNSNNNINFVRSTNKDNGENRTGFHRVYHKDEYKEDKEFFNNNRDSVKGTEQNNANTNVGGSEAYLRSQAAAATGQQTKALSNAGHANDANFENRNKDHNRLSKLEDKLNKYRTVAKMAAQSNNADYSDHFHH